MCKPVQLPTDRTRFGCLTLCLSQELVKTNCEKPDDTRIQSEKAETPYFKRKIQNLSGDCPFQINGIWLEIFSCRKKIFFRKVLVNFQ